MSLRKERHLIREGDVVAEVEVELTEFGEWGPSMSMQDAEKLDEVRDALRRKDFAAAGKSARLFRLLPVRAAELSETDAA